MSGNKSKKKTENQPQKDYSASVLLSLTKKSLEMEESRMLSLYSFSEKIMTCVSILLVAILAVAVPLFSFFDIGFWRKLLFCFYLAEGFFLFFSLLFSILSQMRFKYQALADPKDIEKDIDASNLFSEIDAVKKENRTLQNIYTSLEEKNEKILFLLRISMACLVIAICLIIVCGVAMSAFAFYVM